MGFDPGEIVFWQYGPVRISGTLVFTWIAMAFLVGVSWWTTRDLGLDVPRSRLQNALEAILDVVRREIAEATEDDPDRYLPFIATLFLLIAVANLAGAIPGYVSPTASLSTTAALAACVFVAVPIYGIRSRGPKEYFRQYLEPTPLMLPFNVLGDFSRTLALAVRLFGNMMGGGLIVVILVSLVPFLFPAIMQAFGLLIGLIQAYVFAILALVYIASAVRVTGADVQSEGSVEA